MPPSPDPQTWQAVVLKQNIFLIPGRQFRAVCCFFTLLTLEICWLKWPFIPNVASSAKWGRVVMDLASWGARRRHRGCGWGSVACWGQKAALCALSAPARMTSTFLQEILGPRHVPLLSSSSMTVDSGLRSAEP
ncbi:hypothetical protein HJG60_011139 [Phyllostomus discolor]|uniref:Uncharacterized protein n=1 Tax=Phyllostomus discolor TaxID=89673 RepID=A0A834A762_9CHIR|nr:hypothetical protein HJG60_011139 [Phyllostomus discolor]